MPVNVQQLISEQVANLGSKKAVADAMGVSRSMVSLYLSGRYAEVGGRIDRFEERAIAVFSNRVICPHLQNTISQDACKASAGSAMPMSDPKALKHWIACRSCPLNPILRCQKEIDHERLLDTA